MNKHSIFTMLLMGLIAGSCNQPPVVSYRVVGPYAEKVDSVLKLMNTGREDRSDEPIYFRFASHRSK